MQGVTVITGAAGGIGRAMMLRFSEAGHTVVGLDLPGACPPDDPSYRVCDITDEAQVNAVFEGIVARYGRIDVLVNNAGLSAVGALLDHDVSVYRRVMEVNYIGALICTRAALPALTRTRGRIVVTSSVTGFAPTVGRPAYVAAKHAVTGLFTALRYELAASGVTVTMVHPTFVTGGMGQASGIDLSVRTTTGSEISQDDVARAAVRAVRRRRDLVLVGRTAKLAWWGHRISPRGFGYLMNRALMNRAPKNRTPKNRAVTDRTLHGETS
ncbi:SDR family oxidoreductase [Cryobacterium sp. Sr8]|uniref:SDR family NAD(P)-dependent oxidoreductase n=1 Tax=Cryobacterium sp. Sr8 TaxID=1259203 RepID=UPI00141A82B3|nr:SDR family NAD(P)-dependent oxidoreductase [Cryobacterium sp. Sr8]